MPTLPRIPLAELRTLANRFAAAYPAIASRLGRASDDPDVERICDAVMLSSAIVLDRSSADEEAATIALGDALCPALMRPMPAVTVLELLSPTQKTIARGAEALTARGYRFRTMRDVVVSPARAANARVLQGGARFELDITGAVPTEGALDIFVGGSIDGGARLCASLAKTKAIAIAPEWDKPLPLEIEVEITPRAFLGLGEGDVATHPLLAIRDYFQFPSRFLFFHVHGLAKAHERPKAKQITIRCELEEVVTPISRGALRTNCVLAQNTFDATIDAAIFDVIRNRIGARIAGFNEDEGQLFTPIEVFAARRGSNASVRVPALTRVGVDAIEQDAPFAYGVERDEEGAHFRLVAPTNMEPDASEFVLSARVLATNGAVASELSPGTVNVSGAGLEGVTVTNITSTSWSANAPIGVQRTLRIEAFAQLPDALPFEISFKSKVAALIPLGESTTLTACHRRVAALESLAVEPRVFPHGAGTIHGFFVTATLDESAFEGRGDAELFARLIHASLVRSMPPLVPVRLDVHLRIAGKTLTFE